MFSLNSFLFFSHTLLVLFFVLGALRLGKHALIVLVPLTSLLANLFVAKQMELFGLTVTCSDVFAIGGILGLNLLQECFGKEEARRAVQLSFWTLLFFGAMAYLHLAYVPAPGEGTQEAFEKIFSSTPRIVVASFVTYYLVQKWDIWFFQQLRGKFAGKLLISLFVSQALDTILFSFLGLYGMVDSVLDVMVMSYAIKSLIIAASAPLVAFLRKWVRVDGVSV